MGVASAERPGFQSLVAAVGLSQVGIILVTDVSRLAGNCADWYQLLDLASLTATLIADASGCTILATSMIACSWGSRAPSPKPSGTLCAPV